MIMISGADSSNDLLLIAGTDTYNNSTVLQFINLYTYTPEVCPISLLCNTTKTAVTEFELLIYIIIIIIKLLLNKKIYPCQTCQTTLTCWFHPVYTSDPQDLTGELKSIRQCWQETEAPNE